MGILENSLKTFIKTYRLVNYFCRCIPNVFPCIPKGPGNTCIPMYSQMYSHVFPCMGKVCSTYPACKNWGCPVLDWFNSLIYRLATTLWRTVLHPKNAKMGQFQLLIFRLRFEPIWCLVPTGARHNNFGSTQLAGACSETNGVFRSGPFLFS